MVKLIIVCLMLFVTTQSLAQPKDSSIGTHGMVLIKVGEQLLASHLPLHNSKHAHQIVLAVELSKEGAAITRDEIHRIVSTRPIITFHPETFSLTNLREGKRTQVKGTIVDGHFERGGKQVAGDITFSVTEILLDNHIHNGGNNGYFVRRIDDENFLLVNKIGAVPSFDALIWVKIDETVSPNKLPSVIDVSQNWPMTAANANNTLGKYNLVFHKLLYLEFDDFQP